MCQRVDKRENATEGAQRAQGEGEQGRRLELSAAQVAASTVAAVLAALLASRLGVYGTVLGAGVISVVATCGSPVLQHVFSSTGAKMRDAATTRASPAPVPARTSEPEAGSYGAATTYRSRVGGRRRPVLAAVVVFAVAMTGITVYELVSGRDLSGGKGATTVGSAVRGGSGPGGAAEDREDPRAPEQERQRPDRQGPDGDTAPNGTQPPASPRPTPSGSGTPDSGSTGSGSADGGSGEDSGTDPTPTPAPTPSTSRSAPAPTPSTTAPASGSSPSGEAADDATAPAG
ncbi:hypothetical protein I3F58_22470 [Streptomyces sp. MUM 203J]|uniref:hypothetical protein n=1 Tax=Streptomyces sp. MUM 203J TaxID=2791990 RepID=UPI001F03D6E8|nr:hypothetical protein [Streptomyces sp. MUM 203J]MCH0542265.1 hypothetical protein [Streptomyces sp. MUM 203J]